MNARLLLFTVAGFMGAAISPLPAQVVPAPVTLDFPVSPAEALPAWVGRPLLSPGPFAGLDLPVTPPDASAALLVTVSFREKNGGFLRISWQGGVPVSASPTESGVALPGPGEVPQSSVLCDNFYEGIGMDNQRSLLVPADVMKVPGALHFQAGDTTLGVSRIRLEWLESSTALVSPSITDLLVTPAEGGTRPAAELNGQPPAAPDAAWHGRIVDVPLTDTPLRIEQGVDFPVQAEGAPARARLVLKENGLPWGQHLVVWVNDQRAGVIVPRVPELGDAGYPDAAAAAYVGWREGTFLIPSGDLTGGTNTLQISAEPDAASAASDAPDVAPAPLALKDVVLQLSYPAAPAPSSVATAATGSASETVPAADVPPDGRLMPPNLPGLSLLSLPRGNAPTVQLPTNTTP